MKVTFYYVRHGETRFNEKGRMQGVCDSPLTENGKMQVERARIALKDIYFDHVYSSPSGRCLATASIILNGRNIHPIIEENLHEMDFGRMEGTRNTSHPDEIASCFEKNDFSSVGGESYYSVCDRIDEAMETILSCCKDGDHVLLVTHGGYEMTLMRHLLHIDIEQYFKREEGKGNPMPNAGIMCFQYEDDTYKVLNMPVSAEKFQNPDEEKVIHFYYVNHGQTLFNQYNRMQGVCDSPLTQRGIKEIEKCAENLKDIPFRSIYTSPLTRCIDTGMILARDRNITPVVLDGLKEIDYGMFEGIVRDSWIQEIQEHRKNHDDWSDAGGESRDAFEIRVHHTLEKIVSASRNESNILLVGHSEYYKRLLEILFHLNAEEEMMKLRKQGKRPHPYGGICQFDYINGKWFLKKYMTNE